MTENRKKLLACLLAVFMGVAAGGCGTNVDSGGSSGAESNENLVKEEAAAQAGSFEEQGEEGKPEAQAEKRPVTAKDLLDARNPYIGDASADGRLISLAWDYYGLEPGWSMELQTTFLPYGMTLHLDQEPDNITMQKAAGLLLGLIDNCYSVSWDYPRDGQGNREYFYMPISAFSR